MHTPTWIALALPILVSTTACDEPVGMVSGVETIGGVEHRLEADAGYLVSKGRLEGSSRDFVNGTNVSFQIRYDPARVAGDIDLALPEAQTGARASVQEKTDPDIEVGGYTIHSVDAGILRIEVLPTPERPIYRGSLIGVAVNGSEFTYRVDASFEITFEPETVALYQDQP